MFNAQDHVLAKFLAAQVKDRTTFFKELPEATPDDERELREWFPQADRDFDINLAARALMIWQCFRFDPGSLSDTEPFTMKGFTEGKPSQEVLEAHPKFDKDLIAALSQYQEINARYQIFQCTCLATRGTAVQKYNAIRAKWIEFASSVWNESWFWYMRVYGADDLFPSMVNSTTTLKPHKSGGNPLKDVIEQYIREAGVKMQPHELLSKLVPGFVDNSLKARKSGESFTKLRNRALTEMEALLQPYQSEKNVVSYNSRIGTDSTDEAPNTFTDVLGLRPAQPRRHGANIRPIVSTEQPAMIDQLGANPEARLMAICEVESAFLTLDSCGLTEAQRIVYLLSERDGLKNQEIADRLDTTLVAVKAHLYKARKKVREFLAA